MPKQCQRHLRTTQNKKRSYKNQPCQSFDWYSRLSMQAKSRNYKEGNVQSKKRKAIRRWFVSIRQCFVSIIQHRQWFVMGAMLLTSALNRSISPRISNHILIFPWGDCLCLGHWLRTWRPWRILTNAVESRTNRLTLFVVHLSLFVVSTLWCRICQSSPSPLSPFPCSLARPFSSRALAVSRVAMSSLSSLTFLFLSKFYFNYFKFSYWDDWGRVSHRYKMNAGSASRLLLFSLPKLTRAPFIGMISLFSLTIILKWSPYLAGLSF